MLVNGALGNESGSSEIQKKKKRKEKKKKEKKKKRYALKGPSQICQNGGSRQKYLFIVFL